MNNPSDPGAPHADELDAEPSAYLTPLPSSFSSPVRTQSASSPITPVVCDDRAIAKLLESLLHHAGLTPKEAANRLGMTSNSVRQYLAGRRSRPSLIWFVRFAELCGAQLNITFRS